MVGPFMIPPFIEKYLATRGTSGPWRISGTAEEGFNGAVIIPALAESQLLFSTLQSLALNPRDVLERFLILVVVNHRQGAPLSDKTDNQRTLEKLNSGGSFLNDLRLGWVDAASPACDLPEKTGGVGLARKIGFDLALSRLNYAKNSPIMISLDADTLCRPDYLPVIIRHFQNSKAPGAVIPFCHQHGNTPEQDQAISRYELFLRAYVLGLSRAGSPYAFHTLGSAMACTAEAYVRMGGMKVRVAGEDFYFLEHLAKHGEIAQIRGTVVYPSARTSNRVPFGTGRSMSRLLTEEKGAVLFYRKECFEVLGQWLDLINQSLGHEGAHIESRALEISFHLADYLNQIKFKTFWPKLRNNFKSSSTLVKGFHDWFDGLKTMKLIHHLSAGPYPRGDAEQVLPGLLHWAGLERENDVTSQLEVLRKAQLGSDYASCSDHYFFDITGLRL